MPGPGCSAVGGDYQPPSLPVLTAHPQVCPDYIKKFLDTMIPLANQLATKWNTDTNDILALSAYESGWLGPHAQQLHNPYGLTNAGGPDIPFSSYQEATDFWSRNDGKYVQNQFSITDFANAIQPHYNTKNPAWTSTLEDVYTSVIKWRLACDE